MAAKRYFCATDELYSIQRVIVMEVQGKGPYTRWEVMVKEETSLIYPILILIRYEVAQLIMKIRQPGQITGLSTMDLLVNGCV